MVRSRNEVEAAALARREAARSRATFSWGVSFGGAGGTGNEDGRVPVAEEVAEAEEEKRDEDLDCDDGRLCLAEPAEDAT